MAASRKKSSKGSQNKRPQSGDARSNIKGLDAETQLAVAIEEASIWLRLIEQKTEELGLRTLSESAWKMQKKLGKWHKKLRPSYAGGRRVESIVKKAARRK